MGAAVAGAGRGGAALDLTTRSPVDPINTNAGHAAAVPSNNQVAARPKPAPGWHPSGSPIQVYSQTHSRWFEDGEIIGIALRPSIYAWSTLPPGSLFVVFNNRTCQKGVPPEMIDRL